MAELTHVVILGAGFAGIGALKKLRDADVRITIVDKRDYHTFQPLLYQVATDELGPTEVGFPIRELLHGHKNITYHQAVVKSVDLAQKQVVTDGAAAIQYDYLVLALGRGGQLLSHARRRPIRVPSLHDGRCHSPQRAHPQNL